MPYKGRDYFLHGKEQVAQDGEKMERASEMRKKYSGDGVRG